MVELLFISQNGKHVEDDDGNTPLHTAARSNQLAAVVFLTRRQSDISLMKKVILRFSNKSKYVMCSGNIT